MCPNPCARSGIMYSLHHHLDHLRKPIERTGLSKPGVRHHAHSQQVVVLSVQPEHKEQARDTASIEWEIVQPKIMKNMLFCLSAGPKLRKIQTQPTPAKHTPDNRPRSCLHHISLRQVHQFMPNPIETHRRVASRIHICFALVNDSTLFCQHDQAGSIPSFQVDDHLRSRTILALSRPCELKYTHKLAQTLALTSTIKARQPTPSTPKVTKNVRRTGSYHPG